MTATIGALTLPLAAGAANAPLSDPLLAAMLDYFGFCLNRDLSAKLDSMAGHANVAAPTANRFPFNPDRSFVRNALPALYLWRHEDVPAITPWSVHQDRMVSTIMGLYVYGPEQTMPTGGNVLAGLAQALNASLARSTKEDGDRTYSYSGGPLGKPITEIANLEGWQYLGGSFGHLWKTPGDAVVSRARGTGADGAVQRGFPALQCRWQVVELIGRDEATQVLNDSPLQINHDGVPILDRTLEFDDDLELDQ